VLLAYQKPQKPELDWNPLTIRSILNGDNGA
jgi:hypothetical protein